jgi:putative spermidine/putrescine transport system substrate-binding protein
MFRSKYNSNRSRREFLELLGLAGFGGLLGGVAGCGGDDPRSQPTQLGQRIRELKLYGTGTLNIGDRWKKLASDLSINVKFTDNGNDTGPVITQMVTQTAATDFDLGGLQGGAEPELAEAEVILPWDLSKIPNWEHVWPMARNIPYAKHQGQQYGLPIVINADSMIYLPDRVGVVDSYAAVFDEKLKGKTSMEDAWINSVIFTAIFLKENSLQHIHDPGNLTPDELGAVMEFLIKKKRDGQFRKFWTGWEDGLDLVKSGEVWVMTGWEPIVYAARKEGVNAEYAVPKEGYEGWSNDLILHRGAETRGLVEVAHQFANWELSGYYGCELLSQRGYVVPSDTAISFAEGQPDLFDVKTIRDTSQHVKDKFVKMGGKAYWQNVRPTHYKLYEQWWSKLRSA